MEKIKFVLENCFSEIVSGVVYRNHLDKIPNYLSEQDHKKIEMAKELGDLIPFNVVLLKIKQNAFKEYYTLGNLIPLKDFLIEKLSEFEKFKIIKTEFCYYSKPVEHNWVEVYGSERWNCFAWTLVELMIGRNNPSNRVRLQELGIKHENASGFYIQYMVNNFILFQPLILETIEYLRKLP